MTKAIMVGDPHGDTAFISLAFGAAANTGADFLCLLGDNGMEKKFWEQVIWDAKNWGIPVIAIDGNHDMLDLLDGLHREEMLYLDKDIILYGAAPVSLSTTKSLSLASDVFYMPRGSTAQIGGLKWLFMGGASTPTDNRRYRQAIDRAALEALGQDAYDRNHIINWYPQEMINDAQKERAMAIGKVDVLISHDSPDLVFYADIIPNEHGTNLNRAKLTEIVKACRPRRIYHGHWHKAYTKVEHFPFDRNGNLDWHEVTIMGLDCNFNSNSALVLFDTEML